MRCGNSMERSVNNSQSTPLKIGIVGAGFSGTALAALLHKQSVRPLEIFLFEKRGTFAVGDPYSTPYHFHLLNVRAHDMSAFADEPDHFVNWLRDHSYSVSAEQFAPRRLYGEYLQSLLSGTPVRLVPAAVTDVQLHDNKATITLSNQDIMSVDKLVLATGNNPPMQFPFPVAPDTHCIINPWDYTAVERIPTNDPVLIVGTGLSMIDAVLTLYHHQHQGPIYAVSRHGLLPLSHAGSQVSYSLDAIPTTLRALMGYLRDHSELHTRNHGDWRSVVNGMRHHMQSAWKKAKLTERKRFLRHVLPYWNIHRHRVPENVSDILMSLSATKQLQIMGGRVTNVSAEQATIKLRGSQEMITIPSRWLINCMGPSFDMTSACQPFVRSLLQLGAATLDPLRLGFSTAESGALLTSSGMPSSVLYATSTLRRGELWECIAVPDIRVQNALLAKDLLK
jgi:uncharacterized NAD(P)/FAD-binding protein YdhS